MRGKERQEEQEEGQEEGQEDRKEAKSPKGKEGQVNYSQNETLALALCDTAFRLSLKKSRMVRRLVLHYVRLNAFRSCKVLCFFLEAIASATRKVQDAEGKMKQDIEGDADLPRPQLQVSFCVSIVCEIVG